MLLLMEIYNDDSVVESLFEIEGRPIPSSQVRYRAVMIAIKFNLLNSLEASLIKTQMQLFREAALKSEVLSEVLNNFLTKEERETIEIKLNEKLKIQSLNLKTTYYGHKLIDDKLIDDKLIDDKLIDDKLIDDNSVNFENVVYPQDRLKNYKLIKKVNENMYLSLDNTTGLKVSIKEILKNGEDELQEYVTLNELRQECHAYYICVKEYIDSPRKWYIVMEYLDDYKPLSEYMILIKNAFSASDKDKDKGDLRIIDKIIQNICKGITHLHLKGIAHNDITPDNIMCNISTGDIKFIDFDLSCKNDSCAVLPGEMISGTSYYLDIYQYRKNATGKKITPDERASGDIWAFGMIVYQMVIGSVPLTKYINDSPQLAIKRYFSHYTYKNDPNREVIRIALLRLPHQLNIDSLLEDEPKNRKLSCTI